LPPRRGAVAGRGGAVHLVVHVAAVVGGEEEDRLVGEFEAVEGVEEGADGVVHALDHGGVGGAALGVPEIDAGAVFFDESLLRVEGGVDAELPVVEEEGSVPVRFHPRDGLGGHAVLEMLAGGAFLEVLELPRRDEAARRAGAGVVRDVHVEAVLQRRIRLRPEVPFAEVSGGVTGGLQRLRERGVARLQPRRRLGLDGVLIGRRRFPRRGLEPHLRQVAARRGDAGAGGAEPREDGGARRRAERAGRVGAGEGHAAFGEALEIRRLIEGGVAVEGGVRPAEVVGEDEEDVRLRRRFGGGGMAAKERETRAREEAEFRSHGAAGFGGVTRRWMRRFFPAGRRRLPGSPRSRANRGRRPAPVERLVPGGMGFAGEPQTSGVKPAEVRSLVGMAGAKEVYRPWRRA